jgi:hypothetical protein
MLGLARVQEKLGGAVLDVDEIERRVGGKIQTYTSATKFEATEDNTTNRTVLVEFFTTPHLERVGLAGQLAFEASLTHFERENAVLLTYHLPGETPTATAVAAHHAAFYGLGGPGINIIDGFRNTDGAGRMRFREQMMTDLREAIQDQLFDETEYSMTADAKLVDGRIQGEIWVHGPPDADMELHVVLVERGVVFPGKSKIVIHRNLARGALTPEASGLAYAPDESDEMILRFDRSLEDVTREIEEHLAQLEAGGADAIPRVSTRIDPAQVAVVAYLRNRRNTVVAQSVWADPNAEDLGADDEAASGAAEDDE